MIKRILLTLILVLFSYKADAKKIIIGVPPQRAPYDIGNKGIQVEILDLVMQESKLQYEFLRLPHKRLLSSLKKNEIDLMFPAKPPLPPKISNIPKSIYTSSPFISYYNKIIVNKTPEQSITCLKDLDQKVVATFGIGKTLLGKEFSEMAKTNPQWLYMSDQERQVRLLLLNRVDAVIMDHFIFEYYAKRIMADKFFSSAYTYIDFIPPNNYSIASKKEELIKKINDTLKRKDIQGKIDSIYKKHTAKNVPIKPKLCRTEPCGQSF